MGSGSQGVLAQREGRLLAAKGHCLDGRRELESAINLLYRQHGLVAVRALPEETARGGGHVAVASDLGRGLLADGLSFGEPALLLG
ncbi:hypothetical protein D3C86_1916910 [compost metagenome]